LGLGEMGSHRVEVVAKEWKSIASEMWYSVSVDGVEVRRR